MLETLASQSIALDQLGQLCASRRPDLVAEQKTTGRRVEFLAVPAEFKVDRRKRTVAGWAARYGNVDNGGDLLLPGSGAKTVADRLPRDLLKFFWQHGFQPEVSSLGPLVAAEEHADGLFTDSKVSNDPSLDRYLAQIEDKTAAYQSIGWAPIKAEPGEDDTGRRIRRVFEYKLFEVSAVWWPMNELARIVEVKAGSAGAPVRFTLLRAIELVRQGQLIAADAKGEIPAEELADVTRDFEAAASGLFVTLGLREPGTEPTLPAPARKTATRQEPASGGSGDGLELDPEQLAKLADLVGGIKSKAAEIRNVYR